MQKPLLHNQKPPNDDMVGLTSLIMEKNKKYILTDETIQCNGHTLRRIKSVSQFGTVNCNDLGGYIESEENLSHDGNCWVYNNAKVYDGAKVYGNARIYNDAIVESGAQVFDDARLFENAAVGDGACIYEYAQILGNAVVEGAKVYGCARIDEKAYVSKSAEIFGCAVISDYSRVTNNAKVSGYVCTYDNSVIAGNAVVDGGTIVKNYAIITDDAVVHDNHDYFSFPLWFDGELSITWTRSNDKYIRDCGDILTAQELLDSEVEYKNEFEFILKCIEEFKNNMYQDNGSEQKV